MAREKEIVVDGPQKPPLVMPLVALAHILWLLWTLWGLRQVPFGGIEWLQVVWLLVYTISWVGAWFLHKWGTISYVLLTVLNGSIYVLATTITDRDLYTSNIFILDAIFTIVLLYYFKRFKKKAVTQ